MITNEQIQQALKGIEGPTEQSIRETLNNLLVQEGYPTYYSNGIFNPNTNLFEGVILGDNTPAPIVHFTYDWDDDNLGLLG